MACLACGEIDSAVDWAIKAIDHRYWIALLGSGAFQDVLQQAPK